MNKPTPYSGFSILYLLHLLLHKWHEMQREFFPEWNVCVFQFPEAGFLFVYTCSGHNTGAGNESGPKVNVFFLRAHDSRKRRDEGGDSLKITLASNLTSIQEDDYYPFGLSFNDYMDSTEIGQNFLYNGVERQNETNLYQTYFRNYNPALGRFKSMDPLAPIIPGLSPYHFAYNNPVVFNDPLGLIGGNNNNRIAPGSGNHWSDYLKTPEQNFRSMNRSTWQQFYGVTDEYGHVNEERREQVAKQMGTTYIYKPYSEIDNSTENLNGEIWIGSTIITGYKWVEVNNNANFQSSPVHPGTINFQTANNHRKLLHLLKGIRYHVAIQTNIDLTRLFSCLENTCHHYAGTHYRGETTIDLEGKSINIIFEIPFHGPRLDNFYYIPTNNAGNGFNKWYIRWGGLGISLTFDEKYERIINNYLGL